MLLSELCSAGKNLVKSNASVQMETTDDICFQVSQKLKTFQVPDEKFVIVESRPHHKSLTSKDRLNSSKVNIQIMKLSETLDQVSTLKEKDCKQFWTPQKKEMSKKLWLPTKIDCVDSVLNLSKESSKSTMGKSWFSIKKKRPQNKNSSMTSFQLSQYSLPVCTDFARTHLKTKLKNKLDSKSVVHLKTMKFRLFPTEEQKTEIHRMLDQFRYYYNAVLTIFEHKNSKTEILSKKKHSEYDMRDLLNRYTYSKTKKDGFTFHNCDENEEKSSIFIPDWWKPKGLLHSRVPRGAVCKFTSSLNSAISNFKAGNIRKFEMNFRTKKNPTDYLFFEDKSYPKIINKIKSHFWYRTKDRKRKVFSFDQIKNKKSLEIIYEKETDRYFLHTPVEHDFFPTDDLRNDNQVTLNQREERIISLDPGVRKFLVGYDPKGSSIFFGDGASKKLTKLLIEIDKRIENGLDTRKQQRYVKNLISDLHWKICSFLVKNYDNILLPDFRVQQMVRGRKLSKMTKRLMMMFSFHTFKEKLKFKCNLYNKTLIIVDESFTSCTCGRCGYINNVKGNEQFECSECKLKLDRDVSGSRNILLKNLSLRLG